VAGCTYTTKKEHTWECGWKPDGLSVANFLRRVGVLEEGVVGFGGDATV
jgi:hypothetical protein